MKFGEFYMQEKMVNQSYRIYCDMDGVITNFGKAIKQIGLTFDELDGQDSRGEAWKKIAKAGVDFWAKMPWQGDGPKLWKAIKGPNTELLSAPSSHPSSAKGKKIWVKKNLGSGVVLNLRHRKDKHEFAGPMNILIDDHPKNIQRWKDAGGIGVHHKNTNSTLAELKKLGVI